METKLRLILGFFFLFYLASVIDRFFFCKFSYSWNK